MPVDSNKSDLLFPLFVAYHVIVSKGIFLGIYSYIGYRLPDCSFSEKSFAFMRMC